MRHEIEPPAELRAAYDRSPASIGKRRVESDAARLAQVVRRFEARVAWWNRDFPKGDMPAPLQIAKSEAPANAIGALTAPLEPRRQRADVPTASAPKDDERRRARRPLPATAPRLRPLGGEVRTRTASATRRAPRRSHGDATADRRRSRSR